MQDRYTQVKEKIVYYWPTYGPPVLGAVLVLLALFVGYKILSNKQTTSNTPSVQENNLALTTQGTPTPQEPSSTVTLPAGVTPTPVQALGGTSTTKGGIEATPEATTKGGQKLPETGFPLFALVPVFAGMGLGGFKLSKFKN